jgi:hypothetical protein
MLPKDGAIIPVPKLVPSTEQILKKKKLLGRNAAPSAGPGTSLRFSKCLESTGKRRGE